MAQFSVTQKFAKDLQLKTLDAPEQRTDLFDDWFIDVVRVDRRKVAMVTHIKTLFTILMPYTFVGGAKRIAPALPRILVQFLEQCGHEQHIEAMYRTLETPATFCKTDNRKVLGHMNDFKHAILCDTHNQLFNDVDWDWVMYRINETPINSIDFVKPNELMQSLLTARHAKSLH